MSKLYKKITEHDVLIKRKNSTTERLLVLTEIVYEDERVKTFGFENVNAQIDPEPSGKAYGSRITYLQMIEKLKIIFPDDMYEFISETHYESTYEEYHDTPPPQN